MSRYCAGAARSWAPRFAVHQDWWPPEGCGGSAGAFGGCAGTLKNGCKDVGLREVPVGDRILAILARGLAAFV
jgi:hypothetical protein